MSIPGGPQRKVKTTEHSDVWWEGYNCQGPRCRNPYKTEEPLTIEMHKEWVLGWECRFFGESP
jgi:hypothetical protein